MLSKFLRASVNNTTNPVASDPNFKQVSLLLHGDGTNGAQNNTFLDSSTNNFTVTRNGTSTQGTNTPFSQSAGYWSNYFNGTTDYLSIVNTSAFAVGTGSFTLEGWMYCTSTGTSQVIMQGSAASTGNLGFGLFSGLIILYTTGGSAVNWTYPIPLNRWVHVAFVRNGSSTTTFYSNGVAVSSQAFTANVTGLTGSTRIGVGDALNNYFQGYLSNIRLNSTAVYTSNFTPPTTPLTAVSGTSLLTCQSNYFKDNSSNNFAITATGTPSVQPWSPFAPTSAYSTSVNGGSMYFNGTTDYVTAPANAVFNFGTGEFTAECYCYLTSLATSTRVFAQTGTATNNVSILLDVATTGVVTAFVATGVGGGYISATGTGKVTLNTWTHVAMVRDVNTLRIYVNGVQSGTASLTGVTIPSCTSPFTVGTNGDYATNYVKGYVSNMRVVKGTCVYPNGTTFTPPTAPLTAITNTSLLLSGTNAGIYDNAIKNDLVTVGDAQVSTSVVKYGTGSMKFDGAGDYLILSENLPLFDLGSSDFTIECWINPSALPASSVTASIVGRYNSSTNNRSWNLVLDNTTTAGTQKIGLWISTSGTALTNNFAFAYTASLNTWLHLAVVRNGNTVTTYVDGTSIGSGAFSGTVFRGTARTLVGLQDAGTSYFNGYIDDLRITNGIARYTANFTPPTQAFPNQ